MSEPIVEEPDQVTSPDFDVPGSNDERIDRGDISLQRCVEPDRLSAQYRAAPAGRPFDRTGHCRRGRGVEHDGLAGRGAPVVEP